MDNLENVVEVVRDPSSERANIFKLVAFGQFVLELQALDFSPTVIGEIGQCRKQICRAL